MFKAGHLGQLKICGKRAGVKWNPSKSEIISNQKAIQVNSDSNLSIILTTTEFELSFLVQGAATPFTD